ncbi:Early protein [Nymphon striatum]|nr:Early protein [Nymphon striatum]
MKLILIMRQHRELSQASNIITTENFDIKNIIFDEPRQFTMESFKFSRNKGFGWDENTISNYTFPFVMFDVNRGPSDEEEKMIEIFEQILLAIKNYLKLQSTKEKLEQFELDSFVDMMNIFYRKKDKGQFVEGIPPTLWSKLRTKYSKLKRVAPEITTEFRNMEDEILNASDQINVRCRAIGNIVIDNIFVANKKKPIIQLKLDEGSDLYTLLLDKLMEILFLHLLFKHFSNTSFFIIIFLMSLGDNPKHLQHCDSILYIYYFFISLINYFKIQTFFIMPIILKHSPVTEYYIITDNPDPLITYVKFTIPILQTIKDHFRNITHLASSHTNHLQMTLIHIHLYTKLTGLSTILYPGETLGKNEYIVENFDIKNIIFDEPRQFTMESFKFSRVYPKYKYPNGEIDKIHIQTPELFSWGVQENKGFGWDENTISNYTFPFVMFDVNRGPSDEEEKMIEIFEQILLAIKNYLKLQSTKEKLEQFELDSFVDMMNIFYRKKDKGQFVEGIPPTLWSKLRTKYSKLKRVAPEITTEFRNMEDEILNASDQINVRCRAIGNIVIDNIFVANKKKPIIQLKLDEVIITEQLNNNRKSRLIKPKPRTLDD